MRVVMLVVVLVGLVACGSQPQQPMTADEILSTPGEWQCPGDATHSGRTLHNVTPDYVLANYCDNSVCGGTTWVCEGGD